MHYTDLESIIFFLPFVYFKKNKIKKENQKK